MPENEQNKPARRSPQGYEMVPIDFLQSRIGIAFDFNLYDNKGNIVLPAGHAIRKGFLSDLCKENVTLYQKQKKIADLLKAESLIQFSKESARIFQDIRKSRLISDGHFHHSLEVFTKMVKSIEQEKLKNGTLPMQKAVADLDEYSYNHAVNNGCLAMVWAMKRHSKLEDILEFAQAAYYLDVGKSRLPQHLLEKKRQLTEQERAVLQSHTLLGYLILNEYANRHDNHGVNLAKMATLMHHLKFNNQGYPKVEQLPIFKKFTFADIDEDIKKLSLIDYYTALIEDRPYRRAFSNRQALRLILNEGLRSFSISTVNQFINDMSLSLNDGVLFYSKDDYLILINEIHSGKEKKVYHELASVESVNLLHPLRPTIKLLYDIDRQHLLNQNSIDLTKDFSRQIIRVLSSFDAEKRFKSVLLSRT